MSAGSSPEPPQLVDTDDHGVSFDVAHSEAFGALGDLELEFEKAEVEVLKFQIQTTAPLYTRRNTLTSQIPHFWPTVFDSTPEFDQHVAPQDVPLISLITSLNITRPNLDTEPRDLVVELEFDPARNEWFEDHVLRKQFWWKIVEGKWSGYVSEPVEVRWKSDDVDLSHGETGRVWREFVEKKNGGSASEDKGKGKGKGKAAAVNGKKKTLEERLAGGQPSFFTWFSWVGKGRDYDGTQDEDEEDEEEKEGDDLFNHGDELALTLAEDIYPNAIKYFLESITGGNDSEVDSDMSVSELEDDEDDEDDEDEEVVVIGGEEEDSDEENIAGGSSSRVKRTDITLESDDEEDEGSARRKRVKK
ncbi:hypothetical protein AA313_de0208106 [Arthrobotrys entomopaga]|nr:hypothetical protein AA313_de0208106 [Arthrobotrys entomopaga]